MPIEKIAEYYEEMQGRISMPYSRIGTGHAIPRKGSNTMVIQHNISSINAERQNSIVEDVQHKSAEKLGSGYRINRSADDAAGLAISEKMRRQIRGLSQASSNAQDGISLIQTAEGALTEVHDMLQRMNELCLQAANGSITYDDRANIQDEISRITDEIDRIGSSTSFNTMNLFDGDPGNHNNTSAIPENGGSSDSGEDSGPLSVKLQVGENAEASFKFEINTLNSDKLGISAINVADQNGESARRGIDLVKKSMEYISGERSALGAVQNRLEHTIKNLDNVHENTNASESRIRDTNMASELIRYSGNKILAQAGETILTQANQTNMGVMKFLQ